MWEKKLRSYLGNAKNWPLNYRPQNTAAVMVLFRRLDNGNFEILLTKRTEKVMTHKSQMSFPGGFQEVADIDWLSTALREVYEETGVGIHSIDVWGRLEPQLTRGSITILPFVGEVRAPFSLEINKDEVERVVWLPLDELVRQGLKPVTAQEGGFAIKSIGLVWEKELIWGATAKILEQIYQILKINP